MLPAVVTSSFWFGMHDPARGPVGQTVELWATITVGTAFSALMLTLPLTTLPRRVKRDYPVGAALTASTTEAGLGRQGCTPVGVTVVGSMGEWLEIQGPWGSVAWPPGWLKLRRLTKHTVTYEMVQVGPDGRSATPGSADKRIIMIPRAFLDAPVRVSSPGS